MTHQGAPKPGAPKAGTPKAGTPKAGTNVPIWDQRYGETEYHYGIEPNDFLKAQASLLPKAARVLCLGEGEGRNAVFLAGLGFQVTAVDSSSVGLKKLERLAEKRGVKVETLCCDLNDYLLEEGAWAPKRWEAIVSIWCHLPKTLRKKVHEKSVQALSPSGHFILEAYTPDQLLFKTGGPSSVELLMTLAELKEELAGLEVLQGVELKREIHEGIGHNGQSAVVQFVGVKRRGG